MHGGVAKLLALTSTELALCLITGRLDGSTNKLLYGTETKVETKGLEGVDEKCWLRWAVKASSMFSVWGSPLGVKVKGGRVLSWCTSEHPASLHTIKQPSAHRGGQTK